jgi:iron complex transport system substrate-binding protein
MKNQELKNQKKKVNNPYFKMKHASLLIAMMLIFGTLVGCNTAPKTEQPQNTQTENTNENTNTSQANTPSEAPSEDAPFEVTIVDSTGEEITLTQKPTRIVSLAPSTTDILYFLGAEDRMVGRTDYCNFPETIESVQSVGGTSNPNMETIVDLNPDLVVASTHVSQEVIGKLRELGVVVAFLNEQQNFEGTYSAIENIAKLIGEDEKAAEVIATMQQKVEQVTNSVNTLNQDKKLKVYYVVGFGEADYTAGGNTFIGDIITLAGGENIAGGVEGWSITKEQIADNEPDVIIAGTGMNIEDMKTMDFYKDLTAVKEGKIYEVENDEIVRQAPRVADALVAVHEIIKDHQK